MIKLESSDKAKKLRKQFSAKIDSWNMTVLDALSMLSLFTSALFAVISIINSSKAITIYFSLTFMAIFIVFKFVKDFQIAKDSTKTSLYSIIFWILFVSYIILLNLFFYQDFPGYLFAMVQILIGLVFQLTFFTTISLTTFFTVAYLLIAYFIKSDVLGTQELLMVITSYVFVLLGSNIICGTREVELENLSRLEKLSTQDSLTKLLNRRSTQYLIDSHLAENAKGYLIVIDVDNFKNVNDRQGHLIGDLVLKDLSNKLYDLAPKNSIVGRIGGDEFVIFLVNDSKAEAEDFVTKVRNEFNDLVKDTIDEQISLSIGISHVKEKDTFDSVFARADLALYDVKLAGKNSYVFYASDEIESDIPTMLIVDDTFVARRLLKSYFEKSFNILQAENGRDALKILSHHPSVSIILLDMKMPIMDGSKFLEIYKKDSVLMQIPVVVISADQSYEAEALSMGAKDMIVKPFDVDIVKMRISNVLENSKQRKK